MEKNNERDKSSEKSRITQMGKNVASNKAQDFAVRKAVQLVKGTANLKGIAGNMLKGLKFLLPILIYIVIAVSILLSLLAIAFMPSQVTSTVTEWIEASVTSAIKWVAGDSAVFKYQEDKNIQDTASYIRQMGFSLYKEGFIYKKVPQLTAKQIEAKKTQYNTLSNTTHKSNKPITVGDFEVSDLTTEDRYIPEEGIYEDKNGKVKAFYYKDTPLFYYTWINGYSYFINDHPGIVKAFKNFLKLFTEFFKAFSFDKDVRNNAKTFDGMINYKVDGRGEWFNPIVEVNLDNYTMKTTHVTLPFVGVSNVSYTYDLEGWSGRYGLPLNFLLALHRATLAPDFVTEIVKGTKYENGRYKKTKLNLEMVNLEGKGNIKYTNSSASGLSGEIYVLESGKDPKKETPQKLKVAEKTYEINENDLNGKDTYIKVGQNFRKIEKDKIIKRDKDGKLKAIVHSGNGGELTENTFDEAALFTKAKSEKEEQEIKNALRIISNVIRGRKTNHNYAYTENTTPIASGEFTVHKVVPRIIDVTDHWFRDVYFMKKGSTKIVKLDSDYLIKTGELWAKKNSKGEVEYETVTNIDAYKKPENEKKVSSEDRSITDINSNLFKGDSPEIKEAQKAIKTLEKYGLTGFLKFEQGYENGIKQYEDGVRGMTNKRIKDLIENYYWYRYDGTEKTADLINKDREKKGNQILDKSNKNPLKKKLEFGRGLLEAATMLEHSEDIDSQYVFRDLKELIVEMNMYKRDDLKKPIRKVLTWPLKSAVPGPSWPAGEKTKHEENFGIRLLSDLAVKKIYGETKAEQESRATSLKESELIEIDKKILDIEKDTKKSESEKQKAVENLKKERKKKEEEFKKAKEDLDFKIDKIYAENGTEAEMKELKDNLNLKLEEAKKRNDTKAVEHLQKRISKLDENYRKAQEDKAKTEKIEKELKGKDVSKLSKKEKEEYENKKKELETKKNNAKNDPANKIVFSRYGKGFKKDEIVVAPATGELTFEGEDTAVIRVLDTTDLSKIPSAYKRYFEEEYKGQIAGYKIKIKGVKQENFSEEEQKSKSKNSPQVPKNMIKKLNDKKDREEVEKSEKEKKDAPYRHGNYVKEGAAIGKVKYEGDAPEITVTMLNLDNSIVERPEHYFQINKGGQFYVELMENYDTRTNEASDEHKDGKDEFPNSLDTEDPESAELFKRMFQGSMGGKETIMEKYPEGFMKMQKETGVNAIFAGAVSLVENGGGTNMSGILKSGNNNFFSIKGSGNNGWRTYTDPEGSMVDFGKLIAEGSYYWKQRKYDVDEIGKVYCPSSDPANAGKEPWWNLVNKYMTEALKKAQEEGY